MDERRKKFRWVLWAAACLMPPTFYLGTFGPACWLYQAGVLPLAPVGYVYWPLVRRVHEYDGSLLHDALEQYVEWGAPHSGICDHIINAVSK